MDRSLSLTGHFYRKQSFTAREMRSRDRQLTADSIEKLGSASDAKIHEEFLSILRATCSLG